jgi:hypothetical protein
VDAVIDDYCRSGFGPAAGSVRRYFDRLEAVLDECARKKQDAATAFTPETLADLQRSLDQARREAGGDPAVGKRLDFLERGFRWTEVEARAHALLADGAKADRAAAKKVLDERHALMRDLFRTSPLAVNVAYVSWGEDGLWSRLGYVPGK